MAYLKPPAFTSKLVNKLVMRTTIWGVQTLQVAGRTTGTPQRVPVIPLERNGTIYVVSTRGETEWVRNVRAAGVLGLGPKGELRTYRAHELPVADTADIIRAYRRKAGREIETYWKKLPDDADHPTFALVPA